MNDTSRDTMDNLKQIPGDLRDRVEKGTKRFLDQVSSPFESPTGAETSPPQHVVPREDRWAVLPQGSQKAAKIVDTKDEAFEAARDTAKRNKTTLVVHRQDGTVQEMRSYREE